MSNVRAMLARVSKLEAARVVPRSPVEQAYGSMGAFADNTQALIDAGTLDRLDMPVVILAMQKWHRDLVWQGWSRYGNGVWNH